MRDEVIDISDFSESRAKIQLGSKFGFIDTTGTVVVQPVYEQAKNYNSGKVFVKKEDRYVWLDPYGNEIEDSEQIIFDEKEDKLQNTKIYHVSCSDMPIFGNTIQKELHECKEKQDKQNRKC